MSKSTFLLLFLCSCFASSAQGEYLNWEKMKLRGKVRSVTEKYSYPPVSFKSNEGEVVIPNETAVFTDIFNNKGDRVKKILTRDSLSWDQIFRYDSAGNMIENFETDAGGEFYLKIFLKYDNQRNLIEKKECSHYGDSCLLYQFIYDDKSNLVEVKEFWWDGSPWKRWEYKFDNAGNRTSEVVCWGTNELQVAHSFSYDHKGNMLRKIHFSYDSIPWRRTQYLYDKNNNLTQTTIYDLPEDQLTERINFNYDRFGNIREETRYLPDGKVKNKQTYQLTYDKTGNWIKKKEFRNGNLNVTTERQITYF